MYYVYVLDRNGNPLMPTTRFGWVRRTLKDERAVVVEAKPFTIRLTYETETRVTQDVYAGIDCGRTNIGAAAVREDGTCLFSSHVTTRNKDVPKRMTDRRMHRRASRNGERLARKRLAKALGTTMKGLMKRRHLPGCEKDVTVKDIINTEAKFNNRVRPNRWLTPTAEQLKRTHLNVVSLIGKILPVTDVCIEINRFAFMALDDSSIWKHGEDFQNGPLKEYAGLHEAVYALQGGKCLLCGEPIEQYHHILPKHEYGSNTFGNITGLCSKCHDKVHKDEKTAEKLLKLHDGLAKKYSALSVLNQIIPSLCDELVKRLGEGRVHAATGRDTMLTRDAIGFDKTHDVDAYCIALQGIEDVSGRVPETCAELPETYEIRQFRRHDRAVVNNQRERTYILDGKTVAKNRRKRTEQKDDSLHEWYLTTKAEYGKVEAHHMQSRLTVSKSRRYYNNPERIMPGTVFIYEGKRYVLSGQHCHGTYYRACGCGTNDFPAKDCTIVCGNTGLVYL